MNSPGCEGNGEEKGSERQEIALVWVSTNLSVMYKTVSELVTEILSAFGATAHGLVQDISYAFEHEAIVDIVLDSIFLLGYGQYVNEPECLDNLVPAGATAILCRLQEFIKGSHQSINFSTAAYGTSYTAFPPLLAMIKATPHLLTRWEMFRDKYKRKPWPIPKLSLKKQHFECFNTQMHYSPKVNFERSLSEFPILLDVHQDLSWDTVRKNYEAG
ncbi:hypothetical protein DFJ58DRAFT_847341 [Suillus subalutaceus]|uniref:uncharacterized protein n=1 Tax=Suillus subalutaceus TaxID=48586 RepID=UPI001B88439E|nr:uncharacterized protein DFJ58DRAFT_847341 [Suillus subalutaceus]KAG1835841.1 hypothetical protein DFJ58DRAFT_847341 [Suillus subalutaceus]